MLQRTTDAGVRRGLSLRQELSLQALTFAKDRGCLMARTDGSVPGIIFGQDEAGNHGNFHQLSYRGILGQADWSRRLNKVHTRYKKARARADWAWKELDCAHSSDALLMNIFCHPHLAASAAAMRTLGVRSAAVPEFGFKPRTPLLSGKFDATEIDMKLDQTLFEAKLTESGFQTARLGLLTRYRDLELVFEVSELPQAEATYSGYQLIRGVLAAYAGECSFCVLCDARRPDLIETWFRIIRAVRSAELRCRLALLTWQELAAVLPDDLQIFLEIKYGIVP